MSPKKSESRRILTERFGFSDFREGQEEIIDAVLARRNVLAVMPTGSGKSLCYQLPALLFPGITLVVSPLIALMKDQVDALTANGISATFINSTVSFSEQQSRLQQIGAGLFKLVYVAPERFRSPRFIEGIQACSVSLFAVDEAHCVSEWGHDFRPDYLRLKDAITRLQCRSVVALTATATPEVRRDIIEQLALQQPSSFVTGFDRPNLCFQVEEVNGDQNKLQIVLNLLQGRSQTGLIYAATRKNVERLTSELRAAGFRVGSYHAGMEMESRKSVQERFMQGDLPIVVATNAFGMGIDKADLRFIVHYDIPGSLEAYYQEVGRAGRDGRSAVCLLLFNFADTFTQEFFIEGNCPPLDLIQEVYEVLCGFGTTEVEITIRQLAERLSWRKGSEMAIASALKLLEKGGYIERGSQGEHHAKLTLPNEDRQFRKMGGARTTPQKVIDHCTNVLKAVRGRTFEVNLDEMAADLELSADQLKRALGELQSSRQLYYRPPFRGRGMTILRRVTLHELDVNYPAVERRAQFERRKLRKMVDYAYSQTCLRRFILEYFGESVVHPQCRNCSKCREFGDASPQRTLSDQEVVIVKKCLSCVARMKGRFGKMRVAQVLTGSRLKALEDLQLDKLSTYGLLSDFTQPDVLSVLDTLVGAGFLEVHGTEYPVVKLTDTGRKAMVGQAPIQLLFPLNLLEEEKEEGAQPRGNRDVDPFGSFHAELFAALREMRRKWAERLNLPPFLIFHDETLRGISRRLPQTLMELREVRGIGERKIDAYGVDVLQAVENFRKSHPDAAPILPGQHSGTSRAVSPLLLSDTGTSYSASSSPRNRRKKDRREMDGSLFSKLRRSSGRP
jgi:ATP-dependent DNA helicase RecQ